MFGSVIRTPYQANGFVAGPFAEQAGVGIGGRGMRVIPALLAMEVALGVAAASIALSCGRLVGALGHEALHARPRLEQRAVDRKVLAGEQLTDLRQVQHAGKELGGDIAVEHVAGFLFGSDRLCDVCQLGFLGFPVIFRRTIR